MGHVFYPPPWMFSVSSFDNSRHWELEIAFEVFFDLRTSGLCQSGFQKHD